MDIVRSLEPWLENRFLSNLTDPNVRYEASQYGPINAILGHVFPIQQRFMVKPQAKLRPLNNPREVPGARTSIDSNSNELFSRTTPQGKREKGIDEPDFVIVKSGPAYGDDWPLAIVEIKRGEKSKEEDIQQMLRYMRHVFAMKQCVDDVKGYLVAKEYTIIFNTPHPGDDGLDLIITHINSTRTDLKGHLDNVAMAHWAL